MGKSIKKKPIEIFTINSGPKKKLDLYTSHIPAGFPSPAEDFIEKQLDLNDYLIRNKSATFLVRVNGHSMINAGIHDGDMVVVDRSVEASDGNVILGVLNGEFTIKKLVKEKNKIFLMPENEKFKAIELTSEMDFKIWGVVTFALHKL